MFLSLYRNLAGSPSDMFVDNNILTIIYCIESFSQMNDPLNIELIPRCGCVAKQFVRASVIIHCYSQISLLVAMQIMPCSCKIHAMSMNYFVSSCL